MSGAMRLSILAEIVPFTMSPSGLADNGPLSQCGVYMHIPSFVLVVPRTIDFRLNPDMHNATMF